MNRFAHAVVLATVIVASSAPAGAQGSPVTDNLIKGRNALNDLNYKQADSLGRRVLALGSLLSRAQRIDALQLVVAAAYPEEQGEQKETVAMELIKELVSMGAAGIPKEISWPGLDSLYAFVSRAAQPAKLLIGASIPGSILFVDGQPQGPIQGLRVVLVPPGKSVSLSIRAENCTNWDSTVTTQSGDSIRIGRRNPRCSK